MPWHVDRTDACPASRPFGVIKDADGTVDGRCHATRDEANKQMAALYAAEPQASREAPMPRTDAPTLGGGLFVRFYPLEDIAVRGKTGRTVEAYAAIFDREAEIADHQGNYLEVIERGAFNKAVQEARRGDGSWKVGVFYNHAMTLYGTPSERFSVPIGTPEDIKIDAHGLRTVTRFNSTPQAEEILEAIRDGSIQGMSFTGRMILSDPARPPRNGFRRTATGLQTVRRLELGIKEYGPTPAPAYDAAAIVGVRAELRALRALLSTTPDLDDDEAGPEDTDTPADPEQEPGDGGAVTDEPPPDEEHSSRSALLRRIAAAKTTRPGLARDLKAEARAERVASLVRSEGDSE